MKKSRGLLHEATEKKRNQAQRLLKFMQFWLEAMTFHLGTGLFSPKPDFFNRHLSFKLFASGKPSIRNEESYPLGIDFSTSFHPSEDSHSPSWLQPTYHKALFGFSCLCSKQLWLVLGLSNMYNIAALSAQLQKTGRKFLRSFPHHRQREAMSRSRERAQDWRILSCSDLVNIFASLSRRDAKFSLQFSSEIAASILFYQVT